MSDDGERTCPLCTEEMDLTDQQLKPCKCGYEICVWCWHHIIDMAEKEDTEGRCPACRTPYDKERIVGMTTNSERLAAEVTAEKKMKSQKLKPKTSVETKKHLNSVRVIQRNLVYIIGLPSNLCEESILERKEYFGQYGKILKVSISRPTSAPSQQTSNNNTLSVYITYAKEAEAIRCIQAVHNYILEGKSLRACFGTTKYCHAWLKNMTCSNPDCLYLHDIGSQEDGFTKDEIISAYTRSRVPQGASTSSQRRHGNFLPPPVDECLSNGSEAQSRSTTNSAPIQVKGSPPKSSGKSTALPAASSWGHRSANCHPLTVNIACSQPIKQKAEATNYESSPPVLSKNINRSSAWNDEIVVSIPNKPEVKTPSHPSAWDHEVATIKMSESKEVLKATDIPQLYEPIRLGTWKGCQLMGSSKTDVDNDPTAWNNGPIAKTKLSAEGNVSDLEANTRQMESLRPATELKGETYVSDVSSSDVSDTECASEMSSSGVPILMNSTSKNKEPDMVVNVDSTTHVSNPMSNGHVRSSLRTEPEKILKDSVSVDGITQSLNLNISALSIDSNTRLDLPNAQHDQSYKYSSAEFSRSQGSSLTPCAMSKDPSLLDVCGKSEVTNRTLKPLNQGLSSKPNGKDNPLLHHDKQSPGVSDEIYHLSGSSYPNHSQASISCLSSISNCDVEKKKISTIGRNIDGVFQTELSFMDKEPLLTNGYKDNSSGSFSIPRKVFGSPEYNCTEEKISPSPSGRVSALGNHNKSTSLDVTGERSIISDILSLDFDPWDDSLFSSDNFSRFLGETAKQEGPFNLSNSFRSKSSQQSRFSFARQESQANISEPFGSEESHAKKFDLSRDVYKKGYQNGTLFNSFEGANPLISTSDISSDRSSGIPMANVSAPPGFTAQSRVPPGFSHQDRFNQIYDTVYSDNPLSSLVGNHYQTPPIGNSGDVEFIDPAILAIGKEPVPVQSNNLGFNLKYTFPAQFSDSYIDPRLQPLMQQSTSFQQNLRMPDTGDRLLALTESYIASRLLTQNQNNLPSYLQMQLQHPTNSHFTNSQRDDWNNVLRVGEDIGTSEIFRSGRFGLNNYYPNNEEHKFHIPAPDVYNRTFGF